MINIKMPEMQKYYRFHSRVCDVMEQVLDQCLTPTNQMILNLIEIESAYINTKHPDFLEASDVIMNIFEQKKEVQDLGEERQEHFSVVEEREKKVVEGSEDIGTDAEDPNKNADKESQSGWGLFGSWK